MHSYSDNLKEFIDPKCINQRNSGQVTTAKKTVAKGTRVQKTSDLGAMLSVTTTKLTLPL